MASDWRKCKMLSKGDLEAMDDYQRLICSDLHQRYGFSKEAMHHMLDTVKLLAARVVELELQPKQLSCKSVAKTKGGKRAKEAKKMC